MGDIRCPCSEGLDEVEHLSFSPRRPTIIIILVIVLKSVNHKTFYECGICEFVFQRVDTFLVDSR